MDDSSFPVLKATMADVPALAAFASGAFREAYDGLMPAGDIEAYCQTAFDPDKIRDDLRQPHTVFHLLKQGNEIAGYTKLRSDRPRPDLQEWMAIELERIYVGGGNYRKGLGTVLFNHAMDYSRRLGYRMLWLAVWQKNERALSFYKKSGMELFGEQSFTVGSVTNEDFVLRISL